MISRRSFVASAATAVAAPYLLRGAALAQTARTRRDVTKLVNSDPFFAKYGEAVKKMHELPDSDGRSWRNQALIHLNHCKHGSPQFPHWHRHYLANFEAICAQMIGDPGFALCYWNWSAGTGTIPDPFYDIDNLNVVALNDRSRARSPNWSSNREVDTIGTRALAKGQGLQDNARWGGAFTQSSIDSIQGLSDYNSYTSSLEGSPHNNGHVISGGNDGHMGDGMSPLDPIFWLHHCNVDRLWAQWQAAGNTTPGFATSYSGNFVNASGQTVTTATSANALNIASFNYTYDVLTPAVVASQTNLLRLQPFNRQTIVSAGAVNGAMRMLGADRAQKTATMRVETSFNVKANNLLPNMFRSRAFWSADTPGVRRVAVEPGRILARLSNVMGPSERAPMIVNVFVNCPYLSPETGYKDQHYAGSFSFFGGGGHMHSDIYIDVTTPLRKLAGDGRIATDQVNVQLMPLPLGARAENAKFTVGSVQLLGA